MVRPPFAGFSSLAVRELTAWIDASATWSARLRDVLGEHDALWLWRELGIEHLLR